MISDGARVRIGRVRAESYRHVGLFIPDLTGGGAERVMVRLAAAFADQGDRVDLIVVRATGPYLDEVTDGVRIVELGTRGVLAGVPRLARYLRSERPDAVTSTLPHANIALVMARALARTGTPVIVREASTRSHVRHRGLALRDRLTTALVATAYRRADAVVAVSSGVASDLRDRFGVPDHLLIVIHNPVVDDDLLARARAPLDEPWFASSAPPVVMSVGRLSSEKDFGTLIKAFARVRGVVDARLLILGEGHERLRLEALVEELGIVADVRMPGFIADPYPYMARAGVYVLSSQREGLPGALIQAMACGCRVVSTDCPSGPSEILRDGSLGELVPIGDVERMGQAILRVITTPNDQASDLARRAADYSTQRSLDGYVALIDRLQARTVDSQTVEA